MKILSVVTIACLLVFSCKRDKTTDSEDTSKNDTNIMVSIGSHRLDSIVQIKEKVLNYGDTAAYNDLRLISVDIPASDFFFWAFMMANKYDYAPAYTDVYTSLLEANECTLLMVDSLDHRTKSIALSYLNKGAKKGDEKAASILRKINSNIPQE